MAHLAGADLFRACLDGADLCDARAERAAFYHASLRRARFDHAALDGALVAGADFTEAEGLTLEQLSSTFGDRATVLPDDLFLSPVDEEEQRRRLEAEAGWADERLEWRSLGPNPVMDAWSAWRAAGFPRPFSA